MRIPVSGVLEGWLRRRTKMIGLDLVHFIAESWKIAILNIFYLKILALYNVIQRYRHFMLNEFTIYVDNQSLKFCLRNAKDITRYGNLIQRLLVFRYEIIYIPSGKNLVTIRPEFMIQRYLRMLKGVLMKIWTWYILEIFVVSCHYLWYMMALRNIRDQNLKGMCTRRWDKTEEKKESTGLILVYCTWGLRRKTSLINFFFQLF